jgi:hypothetical protein
MDLGAKGVADRVGQAGLVGPVGDVADANGSDARRLSIAGA